MSLVYLAIAGLGGSFLVWRRARGLALPERLLTALLPIGLLVVALLILSNAMSAVYWDWNGARLAPTLAMCRGYSLYSAETHGPILATSYGPGTALAYLPAALATTPTWAIVIAGGLAGLWSTLPMLCVLLKQAKARGGSLAWSLFALVVFFSFLWYFERSTFYTLAAVHADAPTVGLGILACLPLYRPDAVVAPSTKAMILSALLGACSVWTKQSSAPILLGLAAYVGLAFGLRALWRFLFWQLVVGLAVSFACVLAFGFDDLAFNMFRVQLTLNFDKSPWVVGRSLGRQALVLLPLCLVAVIAAAAAQAEPAARSWRRGVQQNPWVMFLLIAALMTPSSLGGALREGGAENSFHTINFLAAAAAAAYPCLIARGSPGLSGLKGIFACTGAGFFLFAASFLVGFQETNLTAWRDGNPQEVAYQFALRHPGEVYFPWNPSSTLLAEGKLYHFEDGLMGRERMGYPASAEHFRAGLPERLRFVAFQPRRQDEETLRLLPEFNRRIRLAGLPGWFVYVRATDPLAK